MAAEHRFYEIFCKYYLCQELNNHQASIRQIRCQGKFQWQLGNPRNHFFIRFGRNRSCRHLPFSSRTEIVCCWKEISIGHVALNIIVTRLFFLKVQSLDLEFGKLVLTSSYATKCQNNLERFSDVSTPWFSLLKMVTISVPSGTSIIVWIPKKKKSNYTNYRCRLWE